MSSLSFSITTLTCWNSLLCWSSPINIYFFLYKPYSSSEWVRWSILVLCTSFNISSSALYDSGLSFDNTKFIVANEAITQAMNAYSTHIKKIAFILVWIVAFIPETGYKPRWMHATKIAKLIGNFQRIQTQERSGILDQFDPLTPVSRRMSTHSQCWWEWFYLFPWWKLSPVSYFDKVY